MGTMSILFPLVIPLAWDLEQVNRLLCLASTVMSYYWLTPWLIT
jgi:hypothetical protein